MSTPSLILLVGLPASGKSTYREGVVFLLRGLRIPVTVISSDDYVEAEAAKIGLTYSQTWSRFAHSAQNHCNEVFADAVVRGDNIIWDQTNLGVKKRKAILDRVPRVAGKRVYKTCAVYFEVSDEVLQERLRSRPGKEIPDAVIENMKSTYVRPTLAEGFDEIIAVDGLYNLGNLILASREEEKV